MPCEIAIKSVNYLAGVRVLGLVSGQLDRDHLQLAGPGLLMLTAVTGQGCLLGHGEHAHGRVFCLSGESHGGHPAWRKVDPRIRLGK